MQGQHYNRIRVRISCNQRNNSSLGLLLGAAHAPHLQHGARVLGVRGGVPEVAGAQAARHQLARALQQPPPLHVYAVLFVPHRAAPVGQGSCFISSDQIETVCDLCDSYVVQFG